MNKTRKGARVDRGKNDWIEFGDNLLTRISNQRKIHKNIKDLLAKLHECSSTNNDQVTDVLSELNAEKCNLGDSWIQWGAYIRGTKRDKNIDAFRVSNRCHSQYKTLAKTSGYTRNNGEVNLAKCVEELPDLLAEAGIINTQNLGDLAELLKPFDDALQKNHKMTLSSDDNDVPFSALMITESILAKLAELNIKRFSDFDTISRKIKEADESKTAIIELKRRHKEEIDEFKDKNTELTQKTSKPKTDNKKRAKHRSSPLAEPRSIGKLQAAMKRHQDKK